MKFYLFAGTFVLGLSPTLPATETIRDKIQNAWGSCDSPVQLQWDHSRSGIDRFSHFLQVGGNVSGDLMCSAMVRMNGDQFLFEGVGLMHGQFGYDASEIRGVTSTISELNPERHKTGFSVALASRFKANLETSARIRTFQRSFDGKTLRDLWPVDAGNDACATVFRAIEYGSNEWALMNFVTGGNRLPSLDSMAAIMALRPNHPLLQFEPQNWEILETPSEGALESYVMIREVPSEETGNSRLLWLDSSQDFRIRRYLGITPEQRVQIDFSYSSDASLGWIPSDWSVTVTNHSQEPIQQFLHSEVIGVEEASALDQHETKPVFLPNTWVVDQVNEQQYIMLADGAKRLILPKEFRWLPIHQELIATEAGEVGTLIESKLGWARFLSTAKLPLLGGLLLIALGVSLKIIQGRRRRAFHSTTES